MSFIQSNIFYHDLIDKEQPSNYIQNKKAYMQNLS